VTTTLLRMKIIYYGWRTTSDHGQRSWTIGLGLPRNELKIWWIINSLAMSTWITFQLSLIQIIY